MARNSVLPTPLTQRDSRPLSQVEQDRIEGFNAYRRLKLPPVSYSILGPNERILLRLEEEDLRVTHKWHFQPYQLQEFQKKKPRRKSRKRKVRKEVQEVRPQLKVRTPYAVALDTHLESIFGIPIPLGI